MALWFWWDHYRVTFNARVHTINSPLGNSFVDDDDGLLGGVEAFLPGLGQLGMKPGEGFRAWSGSYTRINDDLEEVVCPITLVTGKGKDIVVEDDGDSFEEDPTIAPRSKTPQVEVKRISPAVPVDVSAFIPPFKKTLKTQPPVTPAKSSKGANTEWPKLSKLNATTSTIEPKRKKSNEMLSFCQDRLVAEINEQLTQVEDMLVKLLEREDMSFTAKIKADLELESKRVRDLTDERERFCTLFQYPKDKVKELTDLL
uniref:Uncharacterized protein n=1 Tax=Cannabis sativa TaxID=3483 RepID=A0A803Q787_CANSA